MASGHEIRDVAPHWVFIAAGGLLSVMVTLSACLYGYQRLFDRRQSGASLSDVEQTKLLPPPPRLEADPEGDARTINAEADAKLNSYGWIDKDKGIAHIPIDQAMKMLIQRGWPQQGRQP